MPGSKLHDQRMLSVEDFSKDNISPCMTHAQCPTRSNVLAAGSDKKENRKDHDGRGKWCATYETTSSSYIHVSVSIRGSGRHDANLLPMLVFVLESDDTIRECIQSVIVPKAHVVSRMKLSNEKQTRNPSVMPWKRVPYAVSQELRRTNASHQASNPRAISPWCPAGAR